MDLHCHDLDKPGRFALKPEAAESLAQALNEKALAARQDADRGEAGVRHVNGCSRPRPRDRYRAAPSRAEHAILRPGLSTRSFATTTPPGHTGVITHIHARRPEIR